MGSVDFKTVEDSQPDGSTREVDSSTIHVYGGTKGYHKASDRIRDNAGGLDTLEGHGDRRSRGGASKSHGLGGKDVAQVGKGVGAGEKEVAADVGEEVMKNHGHHGSDHQVSHVLESVREVLLTSDSFDDQTKHSERSDHDNPVDHLQEDTVHFLQELDDDTGILSVDVHLVENAGETNTEDNGEYNDTSKVGAVEGTDDVGRDELQEDTLVDSVTERDVVTSTS
mmetsp:Transcript_279/g.534  ORF Transcript_279/g.534 Transcript_279/m.534 type:complete len:225 (+) Transcript_279:431-1105(+)